jgi:hypothetical protein
MPPRPIALTSTSPIRRVRIADTSVLEKGDFVKSALEALSCPTERSDDIQRFG